MREGRHTKKKDGRNSVSGGNPFSENDRKNRTVTRLVGYHAEGSSGNEDSGRGSALSFFSSFFISQGKFNFLSFLSTFFFNVEQWSQLQFAPGEWTLLLRTDHEPRTVSELGVDTQGRRWKRPIFANNFGDVFEIDDCGGGTKTLHKLPYPWVELSGPSPRVSVPAVT